jgi:hypothetical protein
MTMNEPRPKEPAIRLTPARAAPVTRSPATPTGADAAARPSRRGLVAGVIGAIALVAISAGIVTHMGAAPPHIGITTTTGDGEPYGGAAFFASDAQMTQKQWQERTDAFNAFVAKGAVQLDRAAAAQASAFIDQTVADPGEKQSLEDKLAKDEVEMVALGFYDDCAEDGDVVRVHSGPIDVTVNLVHRVQYVLVPVPKGQSAQVFVEGVRDGTGGITLGMVTPQGIVHMPPIAPGQEVSFYAR